MKVKFILDFQDYKKGDEDSFSKDKAERLIYRGIAEEIEKESSKKKKK